MVSTFATAVYKRNSCQNLAFFFSNFDQDSPISSKGSLIKTINWTHLQEGQIWVQNSVVDRRISCKRVGRVLSSLSMLQYFEAHSFFSPPTEHFKILESPN